VVNPGWGDSVQANKAGLMEIADIFVINKADRKGADETRRDLEQMLDLSDIAHDDWRPPIVQTSAVAGEGVSELWDTVLKHREFMSASGNLAQRRAFRLREELRAIVERRLELRAREICTGEKWDGIEQQVLSHTVDPWAAADEMLKGIGA
jgi:LAO/AO transport system kinase